MAVRFCASLTCLLGLATMSCRGLPFGDLATRPELDLAAILEQESEPAAPPVVRGNIAILAGFRETNDAFGRAGNHQVGWHLQGELAPRHWPLGLEVGFSSYTGNDNASTRFVLLDYDAFDSKTRELSIGPRYSVLDERGGAYIGCGIIDSKIKAEGGASSPFSANKYEDTDSDTGFYVKLGAYGVIGPASMALIEGKYTFGHRVNLFGERDDADYWQISVGFGLLL